MSHTGMMTSLDLTEEIDRDGDIILVCGEQVEGRPTVVLRVSSATLSHSSSVFRAMLAPRFNEGTELASSSMVAIALPDDDPGAMFYLCCVLHFCHDGLDTILSPAELLDLAAASDKYDCSMAVSLSATGWIAKYLLTCPGAEGDEARAQLLSAACIFQNNTALQGVAADIILNSSIELFDLNKYLHERAPKIPQETLVALQREKLRFRDKIARYVEAMIDQQFDFHDNSGCLKTCTVGAIRATYLIKEFKHIHLWPVTSFEGEITIGQLISGLEHCRLKALHGLALCKDGAHGCIGSSSQGLEWSHECSVYREEGAKLRAEIRSLDVSKLLPSKEQRTEG